MNQVYMIEVDDGILKGLRDIQKSFCFFPPQFIQCHHRRHKDVNSLLM